VIGLKLLLVAWAFSGLLAGVLATLYLSLTWLLNVAIGRRLDRRGGAQ
jgi:hypothetical protein